MTKSIEDYPELKGWVTENVDVVCNSIGENCFHFFHYEPTTQKLLEIQATIDAQQERISELESCLSDLVDNGRILFDVDYKEPKRLLNKESK